MFLSWYRSMAQVVARKSDKKGVRGRRVPVRFRRPMVVEVLESRLAPANAFLSMPNTTLVGNGAGGTIASFPISVSPLTEGLGAVNVALSFPTGVFNFPTGSGAATSDVTLGTVFTGGTANWTLSANATADGLLNITVASKPGKGINAPVQNFAATLTTGGSLTVGTTYSYTITAVTSTGETIPAAAVTVTPTTGSQTASLTWSAFTGATSYKIYRSTTGTFTTPSLLTTITGGTVVSTTDTGTTTPTTGAPPAIPSGTALLVTFPISPEYDGPGGSTPPAPGTVTPQAITISDVNGSFHTQISGGGSAGSYTLSPAPPYSGTVGVKTIQPMATTVLTAGTFATGTAAILNGGADMGGDPVTSVTVTNAGSGYTAAPTVSFFSASGSGAAGTAVLGTGAQAGQVVSVTITSGGTGYVSPPLVKFSAPPQTFTTESNTTLNLAKPGLLAGAKDPQGTPITVNMINGAAYTIGTAVTLPSGASLTVNQDGSFAYVPGPNFVGADSFTFAASDFYKLASNTATVNINVTPTLSLVPETMPPTVPPGQTITEQVVMDNPNPAGGVGPVAGFDIALTYDPTQLMTAADGSQTMLGSLFPTDWTFTPNATTPGVVGIGAFGSGSGTDLVSSPAPIVLCTITFTVVGTNATDIDLQASVTTPTGSASTAISGTNSRTFFLNPSLPGQVSSVALTSGGSGYTAAPTVTFSGGGGSGAAATAVLMDGGTDPGGDPVTAILITTQGSSYTSPPTVTIDPPPAGGTQATATASIMGPGFVNGVDTVVNPGTTVGLQLAVTTFSNPVIENGTATATGTFTDTATGALVTSLTASEGTVTPAAPGTASGSWTWSESGPLTDGSHTVTITGTDNQTTAAHGSTTFTFTVTDVKPTIVVTSSPTNVPDTSTATATGTFADFDDTVDTLTASEGTVAPATPGTTGGTWTWSESPPLTDGTHTVTITANNHDGSSSSTTFTFTAQHAAVSPTVTVTTQPTSPVAENSNNSAAGSFSISSGNTVTSLTSSEGTVTPTGLGTTSGTWTWSESPPLTDGAHTVTITATSNTSTTGSTTFTFTVTDVNPTVAVTTSPPSPLAENSNASATGTFADFDDNITKLSASEGTVSPAAPGTTGGTWTWSETAPLVDGSHTVTITATNADSSASSTTFTFTVSDVKPTIAVTTSPTSPVAENTNVSASGTFADFDDNITKLSASAGTVAPAAPGTSSGTWSWSETAPLTDGSQTVTITATNALGSTSTTSFTFTVTDVKLTVAVTSSPTTLQTAQTANASGTFADFDDNVTSLTASEGTVLPAAPGSTSGTWTWSESPPLTVGSHTVTITATNADSSTGTTTFTFTVTSAVVPTVTANSTALGNIAENTSASNTGSFSITSGTVTALTASEGTVTPAAPNATSGTWSWSESAPLTNGSHSVTITATSNTATTGSTVFTFTATDVNPTVAVSTSPTSPVAENTNVSASGTFADFDDNITKLSASAGTVAPAAPGTSSGTWSWSETAPLTDGSQTVTITATNALGSTDSTTFTFTVSDVKPTVAVTSSPTTLQISQTATATGTFADFDDNVTSLAASEGTVAPTTPGTTGGNWTWSESPPLTMGPHTVTITATNADGTTGNTTFTFTVTNVPAPIVTANSTALGNIAENTNASNSGSFSDTFGNTVTSLTSSEGTVTPTGLGTTGGTWTWSESAPLTDGAHSVTITATSNTGSTGSTVFTFTATDVHPTVAVTISPTSPVAENTNVSASGTFADFDDNITKLSASEGTVSPPAPGSTSGSWSWSETAPLPDDVHSVTITATNADGSSSTTSFTFTVSDVKPTVAVTSSPTTLQSTQTATASGTFADFDDNVTLLTASEGTLAPASPGTTTGSWSWSESPPLTFGSHTVTITATNADGTMGDTTFTFTVITVVGPIVTANSTALGNIAENTSASNTGSFSITSGTVTSLTASEGTVTPPTPNATSGTWSWSESSPLPDGPHSVTITATSNTGTTGSTVFTFTATDVHPTVVVSTSPTSPVAESSNVSASGTFADFDDNITKLSASEGTVTPAAPGATTGNWSWSEATPLPDGSHTVTITATNADGSSSTTSFTFTVSDVKPTVAVTSSPTTLQTSQTATATGTFADFDDNVTSLTASEGTVSPASPGSTGGTWTWSESPPLTAGSHTVTITASNADGTTGNTSFTFTVTTAVVPTVTANSTALGNIAENTSASNTGSFSISSGTVTALTASEGTVTPAAPNATSGTWSWSESAPLTNGSHSVTITATSNTGTTGSTVFTFTATDVNPTVAVTTSPTSPVAENTNVSASGTFADFDDNITKLSASAGAVSPAAPGTSSGTWSWSETAPLTDGSQTVTITATNALGSTDSTTFTFTVSDVKPTVAVTTSPTSVLDSTAAIATGTFADFDDNVTKLTASEGTVSPAAPGTTSGSWTWSESPPLTDGSHTVTITATNADGSTGSTTFTFTVVPPTANTVYVDPSFKGPTGSDPSTDPGLGLKIGTNAFSTITAGLAALSPGGTLVIFGGTYTEPSVNFNVTLSVVDIATNPSDSPVNPTVTIKHAVTMTDSETFDLTGVPTGTGTSMAANLTLKSTESGAGTMTIEGKAGLTFGGAISGTVVILGTGGTPVLTPTAPIVLQGSGSLTLGSGVSETISKLLSPSPKSNTNVQLDSGSSLTLQFKGNDKYEGTLSGPGTLNMAGPGTLDLSGDSTSFTGTVNVGGGTLDVDGTLGTSTNPVNLTDPSSILTGSGSVNMPVVVTSTGSGAAITTTGKGSLTITAKNGTGIDVQAGANNVTITNATVSGSNVGIVLEPGDGKTTSVIGNTITGNNIGVEPLNGCLTVDGNDINSNNTGVEIPATNPHNSSLRVDPLLTLGGNDLSGNSGLGMVNNTSMGVSAMFNWWGSATISGVKAEVSGVSVDDYTPFALDATSVGPSPTTFDFFNGTSEIAQGGDGNVYVTGTLHRDKITATADSTNSNLIHVTVNGTKNDYIRDGASNRIIIYGFGANKKSDSITVGGDTAAAPWNAQINAEVQLAYRDPDSFTGTSRSTITTTGFGSDVIFGGGNDTIMAMTSGNNVLVEGLSHGKTDDSIHLDDHGHRHHQPHDHDQDTPFMSGGNGKNIYIAGYVDCTLVDPSKTPMSPTGRLDYETLRAMDDFWASTAGGMAGAMSDDSLYSIVNTPGAIMTGSARATIIPGNGQSWFIVKGTTNPVNNHKGVGNDYVAGQYQPSTPSSKNFRQAIM